MAGWAWTDYLWTKHMGAHCMLAQDMLLHCIAVLTVADHVLLYLYAHVHD